MLLTPGDPQGIGPEVACRALAARNPSFPPNRPVWLVGDYDAVLNAAHAARLPLEALAHGKHPPPLPAGAVGLWLPDPDPVRPLERVEVRALRVAVNALRNQEAAALVTGPIHKERLVRSGFAYTGHTDFLAHLAGTSDPVMAFVGGSVRVALVTVHLPLRAVPDAITTERVLHTLTTTARALQRDLGIPRPRLLVSGLNPHAGDGGVLGDEEQQVIAPAVAAAQAAGIDAVGPLSAEACFLHATRGAGDVVIAMYHDQGLAPLKALDFGRSVNWTLGLPFIRTSVDHGTADDLVGTGKADPSSMEAALKLGDTLIAQRSLPWEP